MTSRSSLAPYAGLVGVLFLGVLLLAFGVEVRMTGEAGVIATELPDRIGAWEGTSLLHCQNRTCRKSFKGEACRDLKACPDCGGPVGAMSFAEYDMLPKDTTLNRRLYQHASRRAVQAAVVLSGRQRSSLHRPELCLTVHGNDIAAYHHMTVELNDGSTLGIRVLDMLNTVQLPDGSQAQISSYYAYWFVGKGRRTPDHLARMLYMALDKVVHSKIDRWAYISVAGSREPNGTEHLDEIRDFIREFYPLIEVGDSPSPPP